MKLLLEIGPIWILLGLLGGTACGYLLRRWSPAFRSRFAFVAVVLGTTVLVAGGQWKYRQWKPRDYYKLESIDLPPGYKLKHGAGTDSYVGEISFPDGRRIGIDIGAMAGLWADPQEPEKHLWVFERKIRGRTVYIGLRPYGDTREKLICVTFFPHAANFHSVVKSDQEIAEVLSIVLTYEPRD